MLTCAALALVAEPGRAQSAGDSLFQFGWIHIQPRLSNSAPRNRLRPNVLFAPLGIEDSFRSASVRLRTSSVDTLGLIFKHFLTDHWAVNLSLGIPPKTALSARGTVGPTGPTRPANSLDIGREDLNPVGSARQWAPALLVEYHFRDADDVWRPFIGIGVSYVFFTEVEINNNFARAINQQFGAPLALLAGRPGPTRGTADADDAFAPAFAAGMNLRLSSRWSLTSSVGFAPLQTTATLTLDAQDGTRLARSRTRLSSDALIYNLLAGFRF